MTWNPRGRWTALWRARVPVGLILGVIVVPMFGSGWQVASAQNTSAADQRPLPGYKGFPGRRALSLHHPA